jgi:hypothetical protein
MLAHPLMAVNLTLKFTGFVLGNTHHLGLASLTSFLVYASVDELYASTA